LTGRPRADISGLLYWPRVDSTGSGHYDMLEVETRGFRGPCSFDASGIPLHEDGETVVKEDNNHFSIGTDDYMRARTGF
jgi:hypothetical protein